MTTYTKRRGRRSLAAILAALLMASVLAVVAGSPAQAANTSSEVLVDHDNDPATAMVREFGGRDRYATALALAEDFAEGKGGLGNIPTAFVASGYKLVDAVSVAGLAGYLDVPILLTPGDSLHGGVADFIENYGVDTIHILGGSGAVSDSVAEDIEALSNEPTVNRIEGADRYETAANAASQLGGGAAWCGGEDPAAILVNGGDVSLVYAMMVGPIAHRLQLPLLMTMADTLPAGTSDFIEAEDIEHVVIVGGTDSVSDEVATALSDSGVDTVQRIAGDSPAATSVELAGLLTGDCKDDLAPVAPATVALVSQDGLPDGVAAAPVLAGNSDFSGGNLIPMLVVGDTLPAAVIDYLAATPETHADGSKLNLSIVAIGGTAAVSKNVMDAALDAAVSADALTVSISSLVDHDDDPETDDPPQTRERQIKLNFSDNIADAGLVDKIRDILEVNNAPARLGTVANDGTTSVEPVIFTADDNDEAQCEPDSVTVALASPLKAGDIVAIVPGARLGASNDLRAVGSASVTVAAKAVDRTRPSVSAIGIVGQATFQVTVTEDKLAADFALDANDFELSSSRGSTLGDVIWGPGDERNTGTVAINNTDQTPNNVIQTGDRLTVKSGAVVDTSPAENKNLQRSFTAVAPQKSPRVTSVLMSNLKHERQVTVTVPTEFTQSGLDVTISAKKDGVADGAAGNLWSFVFDVASTYDAEKATDIDVRVNSRDNTVFVRFNNGAAKYADLKAALEGNSAFDAMFEVKLPDDDDGGCGATANEDLTIAATSRQVAAVAATGENTGRTQLAIEVRFNGYIMSLTDDNGVGLIDAVLARTLARAAGEDPPLIAVQLREDLGIAVPPTFAEPSTTVRYEAITEKAARLPMLRDLVDIAAAKADDPDTNEPDAVAAVATGYAANDEDTLVNEHENGRAQVRIGRSSNVKAPADPS